MLSKTECVWRHLLHEANGGTRRHASVSAVARGLEMSGSTVHKALAEPSRIGAVVVSPSGGLRVRDPFRLAVLWAGRRRFERDISATWESDRSVVSVERALAQPGVVLGGFGAVVARLGGNTIADYSTVIVYTTRLDLVRLAGPEGPDGGTTIVVAEPDPLLERYGPVTPLHQAWVDLFGRPDWQAARFSESIAARWLADAA